MRITTAGFLIFTMVCLGAFANGSSEAAGESDVTTLSWYYPNDTKPDQDAIFEAINAMSREAIGVEMDFHPYDFGSFEDKMRVVIASGEEFDLTFTANWINNYHQNVSKGAFVPLDDLLKTEAPVLWSSIPEKIWDATRVNGDIYGIPNYQISTMTNGYVIRKDIVEQLDVDTAALEGNWKGIEPVLAAVKTRYPEMVPFDLFAHAGYMYGYVLMILGFDELAGRGIPAVVRLDDPEMTVVNPYKTEEFRDFLMTVRDYYRKGYVRSDALALKDSIPEWKAGRVAVGFCGNAKPGGDIEESNRRGIELVQVPLSEPVLLTSSIIATMQAVSQTSKNPEKAVQYMEFLNSNTEAYNTLIYGLEGTHYKKTEGDYIEILNSNGYSARPWAMASTFNSYLLPGQSPTLWEDTKELNMSAKASPVLGFVFDMQPVNSEVSQCQSVVSEYLPGLDTGSVAMDAIYNEFMEKLDKAGAQKIIDEMQRQIDAWKAAN